MTQKRKTYDAAFKRQAVELSQGRKNISELVRELGIKSYLLYNWHKELKEFGEGGFPGNGKLKLKFRILITLMFSTNKSY